MYQGFPKITTEKKLVLMDLLVFHRLRRTECVPEFPFFFAGFSPLILICFKLLSFLSARRDIHLLAWIKHDFVEMDSKITSMDDRSACPHCRATA